MNHASHDSKENQTTRWGHWAHMANWNLNYAKQSNLHGKGITSDKILRYLSFDFGTVHFEKPKLYMTNHQHNYQQNKAMKLSEVVPPYYEFGP